MRLLVIGLGQCGGRVADRFARLEKRARAKRGLSIITGAFAVNTDVADLSGLSTIKADYTHRIAIGYQKTHGHGVGKINELGAEIAKQDSDKIVNAIKATKHFQETDAFLLVASAAGGTGSGAISVLTQHLKERYVGKPVYNAVVLPFLQEETTEARTIYNVAVCLKSVYLVADAVFLIDNQRYVDKNAAMLNNLKGINARIVEPFYNLLCAGEERSPRYIGSRIVDAGDIMQSLSGWTVIGEGKAPIRGGSLLSFGRKATGFRAKMVEVGDKAHAMDDAINDLSLACSPKDAGKAIYLITAPHEHMSMEVTKSIAEHLNAVAPNAIIRGGDYPRAEKAITVSLVLSEISAARRITTYFTKAIDVLSVMKARQGGQGRKLEAIFDDIPLLIE